MNEAKSSALLREARLLFVTILAIVLTAPILPGFAVALAVVFVLLWVRAEGEQRALLEQGFGRYHAPPLARASDFALTLVRSSLAFFRKPGRRSIEDTILSVAFFLTLIAPILGAKLFSKTPELGDPLALAIGIVGWEVALELSHYPERLAAYRGETHPSTSKTNVIAALFLVELTVYLVLRLAGYFPDHEFVRGLLLGVAIVGLADAVGILSTLVAITLRGRPLI